jgi:hypothetical protein
MEIEYDANMDVQEAELVANAIGMVLVGSVMVIGGLKILDILLSNKRVC